MTEPGGERRFDRQEAELILRRATDGERHLDGPGGGLTLNELAAAAREVGIDPAAVRRAATVSVPVQDPVERLLVGAPVSPVVRARFPGRLTTKRARALGTHLDETLARAGRIEADGDQVVWREEHGFGRTEVTARPDGGSVEVRAAAERKGHLLALMLTLATLVALLLLPLGGFGGLAALAGPLLSLTIPVALVLVGTRLLWPAILKPTMLRLEAAVLAVGALVEETSAASDRGQVSARQPGLGPRSRS